MHGVSCALQVGTNLRIAARVPVTIYNYVLVYCDFIEAITRKGSVKVLKRMRRKHRVIFISNAAVSAAPCPFLFAR